jgi:hypothetical protein
VLGFLSAYQSSLAKLPSIGTDLTICTQSPTQIGLFGIVEVISSRLLEDSVGFPNLFNEGSQKTIFSPVADSI